ncbi:hypothetical protein D3C86_1639210 [compost metagenome]
MRNTLNVLQDSNVSCQGHRPGTSSGHHLADQLVQQVRPAGRGHDQSTLARQGLDNCRPDTRTGACHQAPTTF